VILTAHATKVNRSEPNRKRVWPVKITPIIAWNVIRRRGVLLLLLLLLLQMKRLK